MKTLRMLLAVGILSPIPATVAPTPVDLGSAANFAALPGAGLALLPASKPRKHSR